MQWLDGDPAAEAERERYRQAHPNGADHPQEDPAGNHRGEVICRPVAPLNIAEIPPRPWAYGHFLLFGQAAVLGAVDGGGKGAMATAIALSMITKRELLGERVWRAGPVAIVTYEDDETEWRRRIAAACLHYDIDYNSVITKFHFIVRTGSRVCFAAQGPNGSVRFPDGDAIIAHLKNIDASLLSRRSAKSRSFPR